MKKLEKLKITQISLFIAMLGLLTTIFMLKILDLGKPAIPIQSILPLIIVSLLLLAFAIVYGLIYGLRISKSKRMNVDVHEYYILSKYIFQQTKINGIIAITCLSIVIYSYNPLLLFIAFLSVLWYLYSVLTWKI